MKVAINGFGRIGRCVARALAFRNDIELVAINTLGPVEDLVTYCAYLLQYDSIHGELKTEVSTNGKTLSFGQQTPIVSSFKSPEDCPWKDLEIDVVLECTGAFTSREKANLHLIAGAKRVLVSAPGNDLDATVVFGVNDSELSSSDKLISNASCTTNALAPVVKVIDELAGLKYGLMNTIHAVTGDQSLIDNLHKDWRRGRAAMDSMILTGTGAARAIGQVIPKLDGRLDGFAVRVPTNNVSMIDLTFNLEQQVTVDDINSAIISASNSHLERILSTTNKPLVSVDFLGKTFSCIFDLTQTRVIGDIYKCIIWYDNETGFSNRMLDVAAIVGDF